MDFQRHGAFLKRIHLLLSATEFAQSTFNEQRQCLPLEGGAEEDWEQIRYTSWPERASSSVQTCDERTKPRWVDEHRRVIKDRTPEMAERTREAEKWLQEGSSRRSTNETKPYICIILFVFILKLFRYTLCHWTENATPNLYQFDFTAIYLIMGLKQAPSSKISMDIHHIPIGVDYLILK